MIVENIKALCEAHGTTVCAVERAVGIGNGVIGKWEKSSPTVEKLKAVADHFGVTVDAIIGDGNNGEHKETT